MGTCRSPTNCRLANQADGQPTCRLKSGERSDHKSTIFGRGSPAQRRKKYPAFNNPSYKYGNQINRIVGTIGKRLSSNNRRLRSTRFLCEVPYVGGKLAFSYLTSTKLVYFLSRVTTNRCTSFSIRTFGVPTNETITKRKRGW